MRLVLGSASPRRAELLRAAGLDFDIDPGNIDETAFSTEAPESFVRRMAVEKAGAVAKRWPDRVVLGADTMVVVAGQALGKPTDPPDAVRMLRLLAGRDHVVMTGVCLFGAGTAMVPQVHVEQTRVWFAPMRDSEIAWYVATGEPADKAGAYAIQGLGSRFVTRVDGSYSNVVGLPVATVYQMCTAAGMLIS